MFSYMCKFYFWIFLSLVLRVWNKQLGSYSNNGNILKRWQINYLSSDLFVFNMFQLRYTHGNNVLVSYKLDIIKLLHFVILTVITRIWFLIYFKFLVLFYWLISYAINMIYFFFILFYMILLVGTCIWSREFCSWGTMLKLKSIKNKIKLEALFIFFSKLMSNN